jgi:hypothetical protein
MSLRRCAQIVSLQAAAAQAQSRAAADMNDATASWQRRLDEQAAETSRVLAQAGAAEAAQRLSRATGEEAQQQHAQMASELAQLRDRDVASLKELGALRVAVAARRAAEDAGSVLLAEARASLDAVTRERDDAVARVAAMRGAVSHAEGVKAAAAAAQRELLVAQHRAADAEATAVDSRARAAAAEEQLRTQSVVVRACCVFAHTHTHTHTHTNTQPPTRVHTCARARIHKSSLHLQLDAVVRNEAATKVCAVGWHSARVRRARS